METGIVINKGLAKPFLTGLGVAVAITVVQYTFNFVEQHTQDGSLFGHNLFDDDDADIIDVEEGEEEEDWIVD